VPQQNAKQTMSYGIVPLSTRSTVRHRALLLLLLLVAVSSASFAFNTHNALRHVSVNSRQHFYEAVELGSTSQGAAIAPYSSAPQQQQQQRYDASGQIPKILHVNYMSGPEQLLRDALKPLSHFRKEWWLSCKAHHPGWTHVFWDEAACEQLLQSSHPWFLDTWRALNSSVVLKSGR
jgi:mannosyltransferase OCH1-like enzyme